MIRSHWRATTSWGTGRPDRLYQPAIPHIDARLGSKTDDGNVRRRLQRTQRSCALKYNALCYIFSLKRETAITRIFKNGWFERFARKEKLTDSALREAIQRAESGLVDADLGGGVIKQRVARPGRVNRVAIAL